jgi:hypothetical protein
MVKLMKKLSEENVVYNKVYDKYDKLITFIRRSSYSSVKQDEGVSTVVESIISEKRKS